MDNNGTENNSNGGWNGGGAMSGAGEAPVMANNEAQSGQNGAVTNNMSNGVASNTGVQGNVSDGGMSNNGVSAAGNDQTGMNNMMGNNSQPQPQPQMNQNPNPMNMAGGVVMGGMTGAPKKSNGKLIAIIAAIAVVLVAVIVTLVIVLMNNNSSKSQSGKGGSHYEDNDDKTGKNDKDDEDESGFGGGFDDDNAGSTGSVSCLGYQFEKQTGYNYTCQSDGLEVSSTSFAMFVEITSGLSYYQAEGHVTELQAQLSKSATVRSHRTYTTSGGRKMLVFDINYSGTDMYYAITAASSSSVLAIQVINAAGRPTTADLETVANLLSESTIASRLPENEMDDGEIPELDWNLHVPEF